MQGHLASKQNSNPRMCSGGICGAILRNHWWENEADYLSKSFGGIPGGIKIEL